ncbi:MAG TPA: DUF5050 domain-containing protein, partial [Polyangiaceae bacterium]|nr:DUF5050 domain-containing protein [Polyangiaceae bacterium]
TGSAGSGSGGTGNSGGGGTGGGPLDMTGEEEDLPFDLTLTSSYVYWTSTKYNKLRRAAKGGGTASTVASAQGGAWEIDDDSTHVYWTCSTDKAVRRIAISGGSAQNVATGQSGALGLALTTTDVVFTTGTTVMRVSKSGGTPSQIATGTNITAVAVDGTNAYYPSGTGIYSRKIVGFDTPMLLTSNAAVTNMLVSGGFVYYSDQAGGKVWRVGTSGGIAEQVGNATNVNGIEVNGNNLYYGSPIGIFRSTVAGLGRSTIYYSPAMHMRVDGSYLYWTEYFAVDPNKGKILRGNK